MSRNNDLIDDKENRLQKAINYYHQHKGEKGYSIRFVADYFGVCDTTLLRRLAKKTQFRKGRPPALFKELEDLLAETIIHLAEMGFGMAKFEVFEMMQHHLETNPDLKKNTRILNLARNGLMVICIGIQTYPLEHQLMCRHREPLLPTLSQLISLETKKAAKDEAVKKKEEDTKKKRE